MIHHLNKMIHRHHLNLEVIKLIIKTNGSLDSKTMIYNSVMLEITDYVLYTVLKENKNKLNDLLKTIIINYSKSREELFVFIEDLIKTKSSY